ncbi:hypothetical protein BLA29_005221, partial [Euroglyphus maynei]
MLFSVFSDLLSLIDDNITMDARGGGNMNDHQSSQRTLKKKSQSSLLNVMKKMDLMSILINSSTGLWTITQMIEAIGYYEQDLQRLPERIENESKELSEEIPICYHCVRPCLAENIHYVCSHCYEIILCEQCEQRSEELHPFDFIKIKPKSLLQNENSDNPIVRAAKPAIEMFRKNLLHLLDELKRDLSIADDCYEQYTPGTKFTKIWHIGNNGNFDWPNGTELRCLGANIHPINGQKSIPLSLKAGEKFDVKMDFSIPLNIDDEKIFYSVWRFYHDGHYFGQTIQMRVKAVPKIVQIEKFGEKIIVASISDDDDDDDDKDDINGNENDKKVIMFTPEMIPYPDCFNLDIPFVKNGNDDDDTNGNVIGSNENIVEEQSEKEQEPIVQQQQQKQMEMEKEKTEINKK